MRAVHPPDQRQHHGEPPLRGGHPLDRHHGDPHPPSQHQHHGEPPLRGGHPLDRHHGDPHPPSQHQHHGEPHPPDQHDREQNSKQDDTVQVCVQSR